MNSRLIYSIAGSLVKARFKQTMVAAIGVTFSITMFITLLSFMTGLNNLLDGLIINRTPHVRLFTEIKPNADQPINRVPEFANSYNFISSIKAVNSRQSIYNSGAILQSLRKDPRVTGISPKVSTQVFFNDGPVEITGFINGIDIDAESKLFHFQDYVTRGNGADIGKVPNSILLGKGLADKLLADVGDVVQVTTAKGQRFQMKVVAYYQSGLGEYDKVQSFASVATVQKILGKPNDYLTDIQIRLTDLKIAPAVAKEFASRYNCNAEDIQTANSQFETGSFIRMLISYAVGITLLIVAGFGIYNILNMMIYEKMDSIAILKATGFSGRDVKRIFIVIALGIGFFGGSFGLVFGFIFSSVIDQIPFNPAALPTIHTYPINYNPVYYFIGITFSLITTYLAGFFPARKASKVDPVVIIRGK
jgi:lipoprotein-releasing system permease protein